MKIIAALIVIAVLPGLIAYYGVEYLAFCGVSLGQWDGFAMPVVMWDAARVATAVWGLVVGFGIIIAALAGGGLDTV